MWRACFHGLWNVLKPPNSLAPPLSFLAAEQRLNGGSHMGVGIAIEVTTNFWIEEDAFQEDTMPPGVKGNH